MSAKLKTFISKIGWILLYAPVAAAVMSVGGRAWIEWPEEWREQIRKGAKHESDL